MQDPKDTTTDEPPFKPQSDYVGEGQHGDVQIPQTVAESPDKPVADAPDETGD